MKIIEGTARQMGIEIKYLVKNKSETAETIEKTNLKCEAGKGARY